MDRSSSKFNKSVNKQNFPSLLREVKKQGILYALNTGKNNGVYLAKDIHFNNYRSLGLLTKEAKQSHISYTKTIQNNERQKEKSPSSQNKKLSQVESFNHNYEYCQKNIKQMSQVSNQCGTQISHLLKQFNHLKQVTIFQTNQLHNSVAPVLKNFRQKIKTSKSQQNAIYSKIHRDIDGLSRCFELVNKGVKECQRKMRTSQIVYGKQVGGIQSCQMLQKFDQSFD